MKLTIDLNMDNAAFEGDPAAEVSSVLHVGLLRTENAGWVVGAIPLVDTNGNRVGEIKVTE